MPGIVVNGNDPLEVYEAVQEARKRAINNEGPTLIEAVTERLTAHSSDDNDQVYRTKEELQNAKDNDSIISFQTYLEDVGILNEVNQEEILDEIKNKVNEATTYAEEAEDADVKNVTRFVYGK